MPELPVAGLLTGLSQSLQNYWPGSTIRKSFNPIDVKSRLPVLQGQVSPKVHVIRAIEYQRFLRMILRVEHFNGPGLGMVKAVVRFFSIRKFGYQPETKHK